MMIGIDDKVISSEILEKHFCCDLLACLGACCVYGQSGAPLERTEVEKLKVIYPKVKNHITKQGRKAIKKLGVAVIDVDNEDVTPLIDGKECAYSIQEKGISYCGIEKAWMEGKIDFQKPISCHLYPIRVKKFNTAIALNYDQWEVCNPARKLGVDKGIPVYQFLKSAITRAFGEDFYYQMEEAAKLLKEEKLS